MTVSSDPLVSFVIPCYNYARYLPDCLNSILAQEGEYDFEIIVIDDGSTDSTQIVLQTFSDPRLRVITHSVNRGHIATINEGFQQARGRFIARIDPDDRYRPYFLSTTLEKFDQYPEVGLVYGDAALIDDCGRVIVERSDRVHGGRDFKGNEFLKLLEENFICSPTVIARREAWLQALPVPEAVAFEDDWYCTLMIARRYEFYYIDRVLAEYRVHPNNWHARAVPQKLEESSILWILDWIFRKTEIDPELEIQKQKARNRIYGSHYLALGRKYFGFVMDSDARRCLLRAIRYRPEYLFRSDVLRWLMATYIGRKRYEAVKALVKAVSFRG